VTTRSPLLFPRPHSGSASLAVRAIADLGKGQSSGLVPRRTLVSFLGAIGQLPLLGGKITDRP
jgi:hypothetical protein